MGFWKSLVEKSRKSLKYSATDPTSFEEVWSFTSTRIRVASLVLILAVGLGFLFNLIFSAFGGGAGKNDQPIEREKLESQEEKIQKMEKHMMYQEQQIIAFTRILSGEVPVNSDLDSLAKEVDIDYSILDSKPTKSEKQLAKKVRDDMRTNTKTAAAIPYFKPPVLGVVSDGFDKQNHPGVDVVTNTNETIKACLSGTVIYSGFTRNDGYIVIVDHGNGYTSVYKHARKTLKKAGTKVQLGDPIAIVGNTGENSDGPHLHFELWFEQVPVNPEDYLSFKR